MCPDGHRNFLLLLIDPRISKENIKAKIKGLLRKVKNAYIENYNFCSWDKENTSQIPLKTELKIFVKGLYVPVAVAQALGSDFVCLIHSRNKHSRMRCPALDGSDSRRSLTTSGLTVIFYFHSCFQEGKHFPLILPLDVQHRQSYLLYLTKKRNSQRMDPRIRSQSTNKAQGREVQHTFPYLHDVFLVFKAEQKESKHKAKA